MVIRSSPRLYVGVVILIGLIGFAVMKSGILGKTQMTGVSSAVEVKAMQVIQQDTPITYEFVGKVASKDEIKIMSKVSGNIVAKMVKGGDTVYKGQPLFRIDNKQYLSAINNARATLSKSQATCNNAQKEVERYRKLVAIHGVSQETLDSYEAALEEDEATVEANRASLQEAIEDERDTLIVSPVDGRIDVNDLSIGYYVAAGSTTLGTVSSLDPIWVQFSMSEDEYIKLCKQGQGKLPESFSGKNLKLILSDGTKYSELGQLVQVDSGISDTTGTVTMKAIFNNLQHFLTPGMFAKIVATGEVRRGAILVPRRAVKELLDSTLITVVTGENTVENRKVKMGAKVGNMWIVEDGLSPSDVVVVEGIDKIKQGINLKITMVTPEQLTSVTQ